MKNTRIVAAALATGFGMTATRPASACLYHYLSGKPEPTGVWPTSASAAAAQLNQQQAADDQAIVNALTATATPAVQPTVDAYVSNWLINTTGATGKSTDTTINNAVKSIPANVQQVRYTATNVYIQATGIPDYNIGPFNGNPNVPANDNATFDIPRSPTPATTHTATAGGAIGVLLNGVDVFNMSDANSYQNKGVWHNNAGYVESPSFDTAKGHPQQQGVYHNHMSPTSLISEVGSTSSDPKLLGFALDGYPIFDDYASLTANGTAVKMTSSYQLKTYANNVRGNGGPNVSTQYPLGYFEEDYQYVAGSGLLDQYNGAFVYNAQFPNGTYAYFATTDSYNNPAYPYLLGPSYYGTPAADDLAGVVTVPNDSLVYTPEPASLVFAGAGLLVLRRRR